MHAVQKFFVRKDVLQAFLLRALGVSRLFLDRSSRSLVADRGEFRRRFVCDGSKGIETWLAGLCPVIPKTRSEHVPWGLWIEFQNEILLLLPWN